ncbi:MAG: GNAT family N-acetyltransferase [Leptolyngbyaceae cyanobacterium bins.59]|nr:GNAT family N-acetyltransferase [Leptolyngbyaceae cyanobacterium bins.59]
MVEPSQYLPTISSSEVPRLVQLITQAFNAPIADEQLYVERVGLENFRGLQRGEQLVGALAVYPMGQWFGGQCLPIAGLAAVCVAPEHRGTGVAREMLTQTLRSFYHQGIPLATLYASTQRLYRGVGFEQAGTFCRLSVPTIALTQQSRELPISLLETTDWRVLYSLYQQQAIVCNGNLERHEAIWDRIVDPPDTKVFVYLLGSDSAPEGYVVFRQENNQGKYDLRVRDWVALTPKAHRSLWTFFADHRSMVDRVHWFGPLLNPTVALLEEHRYQIEHLERWLVRVVQVPKALALRGYPLGVEAELHLAIDDPLIPENSGRWQLQVSQGQGQVIPGGRGDVQMSIRGLAPLFTGLITPQILQRLGFLEGTPEGLGTAAQLFAGPEPWMADHF